MKFAVTSRMKDIHNKITPERIKGTPSFRSDFGIKIPKSEAGFDPFPFKVGALSICSFG